MADKKAEILKDGLQRMVFDNSEVKSNLGEIIIISTEDKIELCLMKHLKDLEEKKSWITPLGLLFTIILTFLTTDFKNWIISKEIWQAVFLIAGAIFLVWLIMAIKKTWRIKTVKDVLVEIKKSSIKPDKESKIDENSAQHDVSGSVSKIETGLTIIYANYGSGEKNINVIEKINELKDNDRLNIIASNDIMGDPHEGVKKRLIIKYQINGGDIIEKEFQEGETVNLP